MPRHYPEKSLHDHTPQLLENLALHPLPEFSGNAPADEAITDYIIGAETAASALRNAKEEVADSLLVVMVLKRLPNSYQSFTTVITQSDKKQSFSDFKVALRSHEEMENARSSYKDDSVLNMNLRKADACKSEGYCFKCGESGHFAR